MIKVSHSLCSSFIKYNVEVNKYIYKSGECHFELLHAHLLIYFAIQCDCAIQCDYPIRLKNSLNFSLKLVILASFQMKLLLLRKTFIFLLEVTV